MLQTLVSQQAQVTALFTALLKPPSVQIFVSGSGTYLTPTPSPVYLRVRLVGGGGGGSGSGTSNPSAGATAGSGTDGGGTSFGNDYLFAGGGGGGQSLVGNSQGGAGGTVNAFPGAILRPGQPIAGGVPTNFTGFAWGGSTGASGLWQDYSGSTDLVGGMGGSSPFGGPSSGAYIGLSSGCGGNGAPIGTTGNTGAGAGGGSGAYFDVIITQPLPSYPYSVGVEGAGGSAGTDGGSGANGSPGILIVEAYFS